MPWTKTDSGIPVLMPAPPGSGRLRMAQSKYKVALVSITLFVFGALLLAGAPSDEQRISIYSPVANYSLTVLPRQGRDYVGLLEVLEPLGQVNAKAEKQSWKLHFNNVDAQFGAGTNRARIHGHDEDLASPFLMENGRGLVGVDSLVTLLPRFLGVPVTYHQGARRLFISLNGITYKTQFNNGNPPKLILSFSSPVNPMIATEPGRLRMTFTRDPLVASEASATTFNAKAITSAIFEENNGAATITVTGAVPLMASFGNDGRIITIATAPIAPSAQAAVTPPPPTGAATSPPSPSALSIPTVPAAAQPASQPPAHTFALIDASHGGSEAGATFSDKLVEKDINLAFARRIRQELESRGVSASLLRDSDVTLTTDQRAGMANAMRPAIYICIHAAADGKGTRVYTAIFSASGPSAGPFSPWDQAQLPSLSLSQITATSAATELGRTFAARPLSASIHPLENVTAPAIALEVSPRNGNVEDLTAEDYQQQVGAAVANAIASIKDKLGAPQ